MHGTAVFIGKLSFTLLYKNKQKPFCVNFAWISVSCRNHSLPLKSSYEEYFGKSHHTGLPQKPTHWKKCVSCILLVNSPWIWVHQIWALIHFSQMAKMIRTNLSKIVCLSVSKSCLHSEPDANTHRHWYSSSGYSEPSPHLQQYLHSGWNKRHHPGGELDVKLHVYNPVTRLNQMVCGL